MIKYNYLIALLTLGIMVFSSCKYQEPPLYDVASDGVYFDYKLKADLTQTVNFADHVLREKETVPFTVKLKRLGYMSDKPLRLVMKSKEVKDRPSVIVQIPEIKFEANEYEKNVTVEVSAPAERDKIYAVCLYFDTQDPASDLKSSIKEFSEFILEVKESFTKPKSWDWTLQAYLGNWSPEKHVFMITTLKENDYAESNDWSKYIQYNIAAVNELRKRQQQDENYIVTIDIPFSTEALYDKPFYWTQEHDRYLGTYTSSGFVSLASALNANTTNERRLFAGKEISMERLNKTAVKNMMNSYNTFFNWQLPGSVYREKVWVPMFAETEYEIVAPVCWSESPATKSMLEYYYGEYSEAKYKFMLKTWLETQGTHDFCIVQMFPITVSWTEEGTQAGLWDESIGGQPQITECYKVFKKKYDENPSLYPFEFPNIVLSI